MTPRTAVITGAGQGIGRAIAHKLAAQGVHVWLTGRTAAKLEVVADEIAASGGRASTYALDVTDSIQAQALAARLEPNPLDILVNSAGEALIQSFEDTSLDDWGRILTANLTGPFIMTQTLLPLLRRSDNASIINIGSKTALMGVPNVSAYTAAKTGLLGLTRALAAELRDVARVVLICPGPADTPMRWAATPDFDRKLVIQPETVAETVWWVVSLPKGVVCGEVLVQSAAFL
jgi:NAD(P)-dependent dehydrogenase (short-subunit alcohol dehydrogenase family)